MLEFVKIAVPLLIVAYFVLVLLIFTRIGNKKMFRFVLGEIAILAAIACAFQTASASNLLPLSVVVLLFCAGSVNFAHAIWFSTE